MLQPPLTQHHCYECCLYFDSEDLLDVYLQCHKDNLLRRGITFGEDSNYNVKTSKSPKDRASAMQAESSKTSLNRFFPNINVSLNHSPPPNSYVYPDMRIPSVGIDNRSRPNSNLTFAFDYDNMRPLELKNKPQPEIYGIEPDKVHVYQPPQGNEGEGQSRQHDPGMPPQMTTGIQKENIYQPPHGNEGVQSSKLDFLMASRMETLIREEKLDHPLQNHCIQLPQFSVPSTTLNGNEMPQLHPYDECSVTSQIPLAQQINSSQMPIVTPKSGSGIQSLLISSNNATTKPNKVKSPEYYKCTACNKEYTHYGYLYEHYKTTLHKLAMQNLTSSKNSTEKLNEVIRPQTHHCASCNKTLSSSRNLEQHYQSTLHKSGMKSHSKGSGFHCTYCNIEFSTFRGLKGHCNSELHINSVKRNGMPDPTNLPSEQPTASGHEPSTNHETHRQLNIETN